MRKTFAHYSKCHYCIRKLLMFSIFACYRFYPSLLISLFLVSTPYIYTLFLHFQTKWDHHFSCFEYVNNVALPANIVMEMTEIEAKMVTDLSYQRTKLNMSSNWGVTYSKWLSTSPSKAEENIRRVVPFLELQNRHCQELESIFPKRDTYFIVTRWRNRYLKRTLEH